MDGALTVKVSPGVLDFWKYSKPARRTLRLRVTFNSICVLLFLFVFVYAMPIFSVVSDINISQSKRL